MKETFVLYTIHELEELIGANTCEGYNTSEDTFIHIRVDKALDRSYFTRTKNKPYRALTSWGFLGNQEHHRKVEHEYDCMYLTESL